MNTAFHNRIVGSIVFIALIVIFLPDLLSGKKNQFIDEVKAIPTSPQIKPIPAMPKAPEAEYEAKMNSAKAPITDEQNLDVIFINDETLAEAAEQTRQQVELQQASAADSESPFNKPAWVIQLGSFKHGKNIQNLVAKLKREGYVCFTRPIQTRNGPLTKVYVGPELDKQSLEKMLPELKRLTNLSGKLTIYRPTEN